MRFDEQQRVFLLETCQTVYFRGRRNARRNGVQFSFGGLPLLFSEHHHNLNYGKTITLSLAGRDWMQMFDLQPDDSLLLDDNRWSRQDGAQIMFGGYKLVAPGLGAKATMTDLMDNRRKPVFHETEWTYDFAALWQIKLFVIGTLRNKINLSILPPLGDVDAMKRDLTLVKMFS